MGSTKKTGKGRFVGRAEIKNEDRRMRRAEAKEEIAQNLRDIDNQEYKILEMLRFENKQMREQLKKILEIAEINMAIEWGDTDAAFEWGHIIDLIKGWTE